MCEPERCICGKFYVRPIMSKVMKDSYVPPMSTSGHSYKVATPTFESRPAPDGLCARCHQYGVPSYTETELREIEINKSRALNATKNREAIIALREIR